ncbi:MAG: hypothetical protein K8L99_02935 [Anaerolineae bacterium]|nr:hypothetical protein [Anaerolineae bacterium]
MASNLERAWRYLDTDVERQELIDDIAQVRQAILHIVQSIPPSQWYEPRYRGQSPAGMLGYLHMTDNLGLCAIRLALVGMRFSVPMGLADRLHNITRRIFNRRLVETTFCDVSYDQHRISELIMRAPVNKFTAETYHPPSNTYLTVERALQEYFLFRWQDHLDMMREEEGLFYDPPKNDPPTNHYNPVW